MNVHISLCPSMKQFIILYIMINIYFKYCQYGEMYNWDYILT